MLADVARGLPTCGFVDSFANIGGDNRRPFALGHSAMLVGRLGVDF